MTEAERAEEAHVIETTAAMLADSRCSWFVLGFEVGDAVASDDAALRSIATVIVHTAEWRARLLEWIDVSISTYCTLSAQVEAIGAALSGAPIESRMRTNADLAAIQEALVDVVPPNGDATGLHSPLT